MGLAVIRFVQSFSTPAGDLLFTWITMMGEELFVAMVFSCIYWCMDKEQAKRLGYLLLVSISFNTFLKNLFQVPRPIGQPGIVSRRVKTAKGLSFPSGHTQNATVVWAFMAKWKKSKSVTVVAAILILTIGLSRVYLGVHYPTDVLGGIGAGLLVTTFLYSRVGRPSFQTKLVVCALVLIPPFLFITPKVALYLSALIGYRACLLAEERFIQFTIPKQPREKLRRFLIGIAFLIVIEFFFFLLPAGEKIIKIIHYGGQAGVILLAYPIVCKRFRI